MKLILCLILALIVNIASVFSQNDNLSYIADPYDSNKYHIQNNYNQTVGFLILDSYNQKEASVYDSNMNFIQKISFAENNSTSVFDPGTGQSEQLQVKSTNFSVNPNIAPLGNESILRGIELNDKRAAARNATSYNRPQKSVAEVQAVQDRKKQLQKKAKSLLDAAQNALDNKDPETTIYFADKVNTKYYKGMACWKNSLLMKAYLQLRENKYKKYYRKAIKECSPSSARGYKKYVSNSLDNW